MKINFSAGSTDSLSFSNAEELLWILCGSQYAWLASVHSTALADKPASWLCQTRS